ncbi:unnamed protein product [Paramecium sonneborni]|uniref:Uncharacterized protein n=1 Tax=Paramecium sonneborni TaxID=65129 RepID=A0A8S1RH42_9CILI|nr:unnamed protein product [Paramecium sonneborni]
MEILLSIEKYQEIFIFTRGSLKQIINSIIRFPIHFIRQQQRYMVKLLRHKCFPHIYQNRILSLQKEPITEHKFIIRQQDETRFRRFRPLIMINIYLHSFLQRR